MESRINGKFISYNDETNTLTYINEYSKKETIKVNEIISFNKYCIIVDIDDPRINRISLKRGDYFVLTIPENIKYYGIAWDDYNPIEDDEIACSFLLCEDEKIEYRYEDISELLNGSEDYLDVNNSDILALANDNEVKFIDELISKIGIFFNKEENEFYKIKKRKLMGEEYYYITDTMKIEKVVDNYDPIHKIHFNVGNYFATKEIAEEALINLKQELRLR